MGGNWCQSIECETRKKERLNWKGDGHTTKREGWARREWRRRRRRRERSLSHPHSPLKCQLLGWWLAQFHSRRLLKRSPSSPSSSETIHFVIFSPSTNNVTRPMCFLRWWWWWWYGDSAPASGFFVQSVPSSAPPRLCFPPHPQVPHLPLVDKGNLFRCKNKY